jgi:CheY-like chemotaxis protein
MIDDDRRSLELTGAYLDGHGVRVAQALNDMEGLETIRWVRPVAALLDIRLPALDGWEVLEQLRADPATQALPVIIASILDEKSLVTPADIEDFFHAQRDYLASLPPGELPDPVALAALPGPDVRPAVGPPLGH